MQHLIEMCHASIRDFAVYQNCPASLRLLFAAADATWRSELEKARDRHAANVGSMLPSEACGERGSLLRTAYEVRERAYARLHGDPVIPQLSDSRPQSASPAARVEAPDPAHAKRRRSHPQLRSRTQP